MAEIIYNKSIEPENRAEIEKYLNPFIWLIPKWCQRVLVNLYTGEGDAAIATLVDYEYRKITLDFYSCWLIQGSDKMRADVVHECIHFSVNELYNEARRVVLATCNDNEALKDFAFKRLEVSVESVTQDLAFAILNKFDER
jgi:hypothetical protein